MDENDGLDKGPDDPSIGGSLEALRQEIRALREEQHRGFDAWARQIKGAAYWGSVAAFGALVLLILQNGFLWWQVWQQQQILESARRVELLTLLFETTDCDPATKRQELRHAIAAAEERLWGTEPESKAAFRARHDLRVLRSRDPSACPPKAPLRLREEALAALYEIDGSRLLLRRSDLRHIHFPERSLAGVNLSHADLTDANFSKANLQRVFLRSAKAVGAYFRGADLQNAELTRADLTGAFLTEANLRGADLGGAILVEAHLIRTSLERTILRNVDLTDADLGAADLSGALGLTQAQLDSAFGTYKTKIPPGLERPDHWRKEGEEGDAP